VRIEGSTLDFRASEPALAPIELPAEVLDQCRVATRILGLRFTGIDLKRDAAGVPRFLECNTSPMFLGVGTGTVLISPPAGCAAVRLERTAAPSVISWVICIFRYDCLAKVTCGSAGECASVPEPRWRKGCA
jgi:hypothetical protein